MTKRHLEIMSLPYDFRRHIGIVNFRRRHGERLSPAMEAPMLAADKLSSAERKVYIDALLATANQG